MAERALPDPKITFVWNSVVDEIHGETQVEALTLRDTATGSPRQIPADGLFIAIGHEPRSDIVKGQVDLDDEAYVRTGGVRGPTCRAYSPPAISSTTPTGRRSRPRAPAARPPWTPSATSPLARPGGAHPGAAARLCHGA